ncbi:MAG: hypothetical protein ACTHNH_15155, partial [Mesorhizobium sp.]
SQILGTIALTAAMSLAPAVDAPDLAVLDIKSSSIVVSSRCFRLLARRLRTQVANVRLNEVMAIETS